MSSVKVILRKDKAKAKGECPLHIRVIKNRKSSQYSLRISVLPEDWNEKESKVKKSNPNYKRINAFLYKKLSEAQGSLIDLEHNSKTFNAQKVKENMFGKKPESFIDFANQYLEYLLTNGKSSTRSKALSVIVKLKEFINGKDLLFTDIDVSFIKKYESYLRNIKGNKINTIHSDLKVIRRIVKEAVRESLITDNNNPFKNYKLKWEDSNVIYLNDDEIQRLKELELNPKIMEHHVRNIFVFSCYAGGLRISDVLKLKWRQFDGERIELNTQKSNAKVSILLPNVALRILEIYKVSKLSDSDFIFPFLNNNADYTMQKKLYRDISSRTAYANKLLKSICEKAKINKQIHFHVSRHTFATQALKRGMRIEYVSKLLGHSSIKTTQIYAKIVDAELDKAMEVFND